MAGLILDLKSAIRDQVARCIKAASIKYRNTIIPLYGLNGKGKLCHIGTGFVVEYKNKKYLVTAAHVVDGAVGSGIWLGGDGRMVEVEGTFLCTNIEGEDRHNDHYDFAFNELSDGFFESLGDVGFIKEIEISRNMVDPDKRVYLAMGFPHSKNKVRIPSVTIKPRVAKYYSTWKPMSDLFEYLGLGGGDHIAIDYNKKARDDKGDTVNAFRPTGMSGGIMIDMGSTAKPEDFARKEAFSGLLAGVLIEHHKKYSALLAVKINLVVQAIEDSLD